MENKIGGYLEVYDLEYPVIALKYYFGEDTERTVNNSVEFIPIINDKCLCGLRGDYEAGLGAVINTDIGGSEYGQRFTVNGENERCFSGTFGAERFEIVDNNTLVDNEAHVKYMFDFSKSEPCYTVEKIK